MSSLSTASFWLSAFLCLLLHCLPENKTKQTVVMRLHRIELLPTNACYQNRIACVPSSWFGSGPGQPTKPAISLGLAKWYMPPEYKTLADSSAWFLKSLNGRKTLFKFTIQILTIVVPLCPIGTSRYMKSCPLLFLEVWRNLMCTEW